MTNHYDPNQPRVPVGHHDGGRWTGGGAGLLDAIIGPRSGDGRDGNPRLAFLDPLKSPPPIQLPRPKPAPWVPLKPGILTPLRRLPYVGAALTLYSLLSELNDDEQQTIISFRSREFRKGPESFDLEGVHVLSQQEASDICGGYFKKIQELTDKAFDEFKKDKSLSPSQLGTAVHKKVEQEIKGIGDEKLNAELSFAKEDGADRRGAKDTVRLDVYNRVDDKTLCIDDIKTGQSELSYKRMKELVSAVSKKYSKIERIIVTEVRPTGMRPPKPRPPTLQKD